MTVIALTIEKHYYFIIPFDVFDAPKSNNGVLVFPLAVGY
jgi:hypothetical protein